MFALPEYWWLLALAMLPQVAFAVVLAIFRKSGTRAGNAGRIAPAVPLWAVIMLCIGAAIGIGYGVVQHDGVFILGQVCILVIALVRQRMAKRALEDITIE